MTRREEIIKQLRVKALSVEDISVIFGAYAKDILEDLQHIAKSVRPREKLVMQPAQCKKCGYVFTKRSKVQTPSKCPQCKGDWIQPPLFKID